MLKEGLLEVSIKFAEKKSCSSCIYLLLLILSQLSDQAVEQIQSFMDIMFTHMISVDVCEPLEGNPRIQCISCDTGSAVGSLGCQRSPRLASLSWLFRNPI